MTHLVDAGKCGCRGGVACRLCVREAARRAGRAAPPPPPLPRADRPPCIHLGDVADGCNTCGAGGKTRECDLHGRCTLEKTVGKHLPVCATCPDYRPDSTTLSPAAHYGHIDLPPISPVPPMPPSPPRWRPIPPPTITPTHPRAVITAAIGPHADAIHRVTGPSQRRYAKRIGAEYVVLRDATQDHRVPCAEKWRLKDWVPHYPGGTLWLDADVFVMSDAPDIFAATPEDTIGMVDISHQSAILQWVPHEYLPLCRSQGVEPLLGPQRVYWNSGVWVGRPAHAHYWEPPPRPFPATWCVEEHWCRHTVFAENIPVHTLEWRWNWTWPQDRQFRQWEQARPWMVHMAGMGNQPIKAWEQSNKEWQMALLRVMAAMD